ncbi:protein lifeguard 2-like [Rhynchocyon petersi]
MNTNSTLSRKMNLEVIKPIDFSSGDHLYLVRKAADNENVESKPGQRTTPLPVPTQTPGNPKSKADEQSKVYVVQISDDSTPDNSNETNSPFSDKSIRRAFFVILLVLACCGKLRRQVPANYILLALFTILQGLLLGTVSVFYNAEEVLWAIGATALVTLSLTLFALQTKWDFTLLNGVLLAFLFILLIYGILVIVLRSYWLHLVYAALGTVVFSFYLVMDVQLMVGGRHHHSDLDPEEYVFAALNIYLDVINLFIFILQLLGLAR